MRTNRAAAETFDSEVEQDDPSFQWPPPEDDVVIEEHLDNGVLEVFAADEPHETAPAEYRRGRTIRSRALPIAFGLLLMLAVGETVYIIRTSMSGSPPDPVATRPAATAPSPQPSPPETVASTPLPPPMPGPTEKASIVPPAKNNAAKPADDGRGFLTIDSPVELDVYRGQRLVGRSRSRLTLPAGVHTLVLVNDSLRYKRSERVRVEATRNSRLNISLPQSTVHLNAQPWAEVWIDGKPAGETPLGNLSLPIGAHDIVFRHPELGERTVSTVVRVGLPTRVSVDLRK